MTFLIALVLAQTQPADVSRGEYISRQGDCISCHTIPGGKTYAGGRKIETPFGELYTPNLTPDDETGIGRWTKDDFYRALHDGVSPDGEYYYPAFPYDFFTKLTREDTDALFEYLKSLKPFRNKVKVNELRFPFNLRPGLFVWRKLYFNKGEFQPNATKGEQWNRGAYLVEGSGHCGACHTPRSILGGVKQDRAFEGGMVDRWLAPDITPNPMAAVSDWTVEDFVAFFKTGTNPQGETALGPMAEVIDLSLKYLSDEDLTAIAVYLKSMPVEITDEGNQLRKARVLFLQNCAGCHHPHGAGRPGWAPAFVDNSILQNENPTNLLNVVLIGVPANDGYPEMPAFQNKLTDQEVLSLLTFLRLRWGNGKPVSQENLNSWRELHK